MSIPTVLGRFGELAQDARQGHMQTPYAVAFRFTLRSTGGTKVLCSIPADTMYIGSHCEVLIAHNGTTPTITLGTYKPDGTVDDADELIASDDFDLTSTGYTVDVSLAGVLTEDEPRLLVLTAAAAAAPTAGEAIIAVQFVPLTTSKIIAL